ncbi:MAG: hypothetical protein KDC09_00875 [Bacteroidales bacterium]|nr:hypothetical protein [Bacteroidales bacterium]
MIIRFFKSSYLPQYVALIMLGIALWLPSLFKANTLLNFNSDLAEPGYGLVLNLFSPDSFFGITISFLFTMGSALLFNFVLERHELTTRNSLLPAFIFILFTGILPGLHWFHQSIIPVFLLILLLNNLLEMHNIEEGYSQVFYAGVLIALSSLFSFQSVFFILLVYLSFFVFRIYYWREWVIVLIGLINVYLLLWVYYFWTDNLNEVFTEYLRYFGEITFFRFQGPYDFLSLLLIAVLVILSLWALFRILVRYSDNILVIRKKLTVVLWFALIAAIITIISGGMNDTYRFILLSALASITCIGLSQLKKSFWMDITLGVFLLLTLISNYSKLVF